MKKFSFLFFGAAFLALARPAFAGTVTVNAGTAYQTIDGFGGSCVYHAILSSEAPILWADDSSYPVSVTTAHVNGDVGLSILRTRIDETEETAGTGVWTATNDVAAMKLAQGQNPNVLIFSSEWSPPNNDKENGQENGGSANNCFLGLPTTNDGNAGNAAADTDYSNYLVKYTQTIKNAEGISLYAISPQNESDYNTSYESCLWTGSQFETFVGSYLGPAMANAGLTATKIMITESFKDNLALASNTMDDATAAPYVGILAGHLYGSPEPPATLASANFSHLTNQRYWETEIANLGSAWDATMAIGLQEAQWIHNCIVDAGMNAYNHWSLNSTSEDAFYNTNTGQWSSACYVEGNYSKFVRKGFVRVSATEFPSGGTGTGTGAPVWCSAYVSPTLSRVVIVAVNDSTSSQSETFSLTGLGTVPEVAPWLTDLGNGLVQQAQVTVSGNSFTYTLPAQSVMTFVGDCVQSTSTSTATATRTGTATPTKTYTLTFTSTPTNTPTWTTTATRTSTSTASSTATSTVTRTSTPSATSTPTSTFTIIPTITITASRTFTPTIIPTRTSTQTSSYTPSSTASQTPTTSMTPTGTASLTASRTFTPTHTITSTDTGTLTVTRTPTQTPVFSPTFTNSPTATLSPTSTETSTLTKTPTPTLTASWSITPTVSLTETGTPSLTPTISGTPTQTPVFSPTVTHSPTVTLSPTSTWTETSSVTATPTFTDTVTLTPTATVTGTESATASQTPTASFTPSGTASLTPTVSETPTRTPMFSPTMTLSPTSTETATWTKTATPTFTYTWSFTPTSTETVTPSWTPTFTATPTLTTVFSPTPTYSSTASFTPSFTATPSFTPTASTTATSSMTPSATASQTPTASLTPTGTASLTASRTITPTTTVTSTPSTTVTATATWSASMTSTPEFTDTATPAPSVPSGIAGIYPNPVAGPTVEILPSGYTGISNIRIEIFTISFRKVRDETFPSIPSGTAVTLTLTARGGAPLANGLYYVVVTTKSGRTIGKLLVLK